jgi:transposase-like protein
LDEAFVKLNGKLCYLWRAVDHEGEVLEAVVTAKRDKAAALKFLKRFSVLASSRTCSREGRIWLTSPA